MGPRTLSLRLTSLRVGLTFLTLGLSSTIRSRSTEDYVHRIGRTGRGGKTGRSITFFTGDGHEKALAGELARILDDAGVDCTELREKFPMTIKKKTHSVYGAFFRDESVSAPRACVCTMLIQSPCSVPQVAPTKIKFD
jgi:hypothetical protein